MSKFVSNPNLPLCLDRLIIGEKYRNLLDKPLKSRGLRPIYMPDNPDVAEQLSSHADLSLLHTGGDRLILAPFLKNTEFSRNIAEIGFKLSFSDIKQKSNYPNDAQINCCICGKWLICSEKVTDSSIINNLTKELKPIFVKQGYVKCSVCVVDSKSIITSDRGVYTVCSDAGMDVLLINPGYIDLDGYEYGFIGGSSFKISSDKLAFTGRLDAHPDRAPIIDFLKYKGVEPVFLTERNIFDIGSAVCITENE